MAFEFHHDQERYWQMQYLCAKEYIIPFLENECKINLRGKSVLEIGCGEGGVIAAFYDYGCHAVGMDVSEVRLKKAAALAATDHQRRAIKFACVDILQPEQTAGWQHQFDLIVMKDVIEHLPGHRQVLGHVATLLKPQGHLFLSFPPWYMPYGAHQQMFDSILKFAPFIHLLPRSWFRWLAQRFGERETVIDELSDLYHSRLSLTAFNKLLRKMPFKVVYQRLYLTNPMYKYKFGLRPIQHPAVVAHLPVLREFLTTAAYCTLQLQTDENEPTK
ncbi:MAG: class I SAM-dependent methyltransferase [candidate division KSB1 bacterium]|nr:class I SAM-dependent methyltransferase [candidate division KSB1 bacterium]MDZ7302892.1 class I SAM-dependent methyltransferase [candidate division KSB1 bacterium]MDZ7310467.1 class I SAM-dependent methyltransferase [candidate division KSB1 bacterium]